MIGLIHSVLFVYLKSGVCFTPVITFFLEQVFLKFTIQVIDNGILFGHWCGPRRKTKRTEV
jgi:hypothetical protein